jgi:hypothetical protein
MPAPNQCSSDSIATAAVPSGRGARIYARRWRAEVTYFWVFYNRGNGWLEDGPPFVAIDPQNVVPNDTFEWSPRTAGAFDPVPGGTLQIRIQARGNWNGIQDRCITAVKVPAEDRTTFHFYTGNNEPYNMEIHVVYS